MCGAGEAPRGERRVHNAAGPPARPSISQVGLAGVTGQSFRSPTPLCYEVYDSDDDHDGKEPRYGTPHPTPYPMDPSANV
jgi:hypothetical protein